MAYRVNNINKCKAFLEKLRSHGWRLWQMQYRATDENGFHCWFWKTGEKDIEIVTYNEKVQQAILEYPLT